MKTKKRHKKISTAIQGATFTGVAHICHLLANVGILPGKIRVP
jgi:hypothetical protein